MYAPLPDKYFPRLCNNETHPGRALSYDDVSNNRRFNNLWLVLSDQELPAALQETEQVWSLNRTSFNDHMLVQLTQNVTLRPRGASGSSPYVITGTEVIMGPPSQAPGLPRQVVAVDMSAASPTSPVFTLQPPPNSRNVLLFMTHLVVRGLVAAPLNETGDPAASSTSVSALPFWAVQHNPRYPSRVRLHDVTLVLPLPDYAALLSAALRGEAWRSGAAATAPLMAGIRQLVVAEDQSGKPVSPSSPSLLLTSYQGWGVSATQLELVPDTPLPACQPLPDWPQLAPECTRPEGSSGGNSKPKSVAIGVGVGVGVGGSALLALVVGTAVIIARRGRGSPDAEQNPPSKQFKAHSSSSHTDISTNAQSSSPAAPDAACSAAVLHEIHVGVAASQLRLRDAVAAAQQRAPPGSSSSQGEVLLAVLRSAQESTHMETVAKVAEQLKADDADRVVLGKALGKGSWGAVYVGSWRGLAVAVKTMLFPAHTGACGNGPGRHGWAVSEAATCMSLNHPNIVATYRYDVQEVCTMQEEGQLLRLAPAGGAAHAVKEVSAFKLYLIQELCDESLRAMCEMHIFHDRGGDALILLLLAIFIDIASGLEYLHGKGIVHGDLKPDNVLIKLDGRTLTGWVVKLTDFGFSQALGPDRTHVSNFAAGTPYYVAPEVLMHRHGTTASDIYSFGVLMWELYSGRAPWTVVHGKGDDVSFIKNNSFLEVPPNCDQMLMQLVFRCLLVNSGDRPTAGLLLSELANVLARYGLSPADLMPAASAGNAETVEE
uniref:Protein kinase domain-containing protein n=1 Tax=Chlamydomonas leiostraca TaxID=1034604 RepID=A0A7S0R9B6_9CHLO